MINKKDIEELAKHCYPYHHPYRVIDTALTSLCIKNAAKDMGCDESDIIKELNDYNIHMLDSDGKPRPIWDVLHEMIDRTEEYYKEELSKDEPEQAAPDDTKDGGDGT